MQQNLWNDSYTILSIDTGLIGQTRLRRYLNWLDQKGYDWTTPHLEEYADSLRKRALHSSTISQNTSEIREHYLAILSEPDHYAHIEEGKRSEIINQILQQLGFNLASVSYERLIQDGEIYASENMEILSYPGAHIHRDTQITTFIHWLDNTGRHWTNPDLIEYKEYLIIALEATSDVISNSISCIRRRYFELVEDDAAMQRLSEDERQEFTAELRKRLGYLDQYPSRTVPVRAMLEDDPSNKQYLTSEQIMDLLNQPASETFIGLRDRALLSIAVAMGLQPSEIAKITVDHLRCHYEGVLALFVEGNKQRPERYIPYEDMEWVLGWVDEWLAIAQITEGAVFRGTYGNRDVLRPHGIAAETAGDILSRYPIHINGSNIPLLFSDLQATCARRWYDAGHNLDEIERRMGRLYRRATLKMLGLRVRKGF